MILLLRDVLFVLAAGILAVPPITSNPVVPSAADRVQAAREALAQQHFEHARDLLAEALPEARDASERREISRLLECAQRPLWLAEHVASSLESSKLQGTEVRLLDGRTGSLHSAVDGRLEVLTGTRVRTVSPGDISGESWLRLTKPMKLSPEDTLNRCYLALSLEAFQAFDVAIRRAARANELRASVDSALAFRLGFEDVPPGGFEWVEGRWLTVAEKTTLERQREIEATVASLLKDGQKDRARASLDTWAETYLSEVIEVFHRRRSEVVERWATIPEKGRLSTLRSHREALDRARDHALELIFDAVKYFYPYRPPQCPPEKAKLYPEVQEDVDDRVAKVREIWGSEFDDKIQGPKVKLSRETQRLIAEIHLLETELKRLEGPAYQPAESLELARCLPDDRIVHLRNYAIDAEERVRFQRNDKVRDLNAKSGIASRQELKQVQITNDYREMLGRGRLEIVEAVQLASRKHSEWMAKVGRLTHFRDDDPSMRSPMDRLRAEGYEAGAGENIYGGSGSAARAHQAWIHSSGHHRNLLMESHRDMASGQAGRYWTQNFGGSRAYRGNLGG